MKFSCLLAPLLLAAGMAPALASGFDCVQPSLPERSTTNESVRRVQKQIRAWYACYSDFAATGQATRDAERVGAEVDADIGRWLENTRAYSKQNRSHLAHFERERSKSLRAARGRTLRN